VSGYGSGLWSVWARCGRLVSEAQDALYEPLESADSDDSPEAREQLRRVIAAAQELRRNLETNYDIGNGQCDRKETPCG
jgi:hypothetical protein